MESTFVTIIEIIGTMAFAISGIRLASAKKFDWFGAYVVGLVTAIGGGTLRDVLLDLPAFWMQNSIYSCNYFTRTWHSPGYFCTAKTRHCRIYALIHHSALNNQWNTVFPCRILYVHIDQHRNDQYAEE